MEKCKRTWFKQEKRIVRLLYKKGLINVSVDRLYWQEFHRSGKKYKSGKFRFQIYYPEMFYCVTDYWGESDDYGIVSRASESLYWGNLKEHDGDYGTYPESNFKMKGRNWFIKYLKKMPTINSDNKIKTAINSPVNH